MTIETLESMTTGLADRDYAGYADRVAAAHPALGATARMHAEAADGNSPDLRDWPQHTLDDAACLAAEGISDDDEAGARDWWIRRYAAA